MTPRRSFLRSILAAGMAPAICKAEILMPVRKIIVPPPLIKGEIGVFRACTIIRTAPWAAAEWAEILKREVEQTSVLRSILDEKPRKQIDDAPLVIVLQPKPDLYQQLLKFPTWMVIGASPAPPKPG